MARIFISYRREDSGASAGRLHDRLREHFGRDNVFMDIDTIEPGLDFTEVIERTVASCDVLIALIGRQWLTSTDAAGQRRLEDPDDFVRREIATALRRNIRVIPALVQDTSMPRAADLPDDLQPLTRRNAVDLSDTHFHRDVDYLIEVLDRVLGMSPSPSSPVEIGPPHVLPPGRPSYLRSWRLWGLACFIFACIAFIVVLYAIPQLKLSEPPGSGTTVVGPPPGPPAQSYRLTTALYKQGLRFHGERGSSNIEVSIFVNGVQVGVYSSDGVDADISQFLKPGPNNVRIAWTADPDMTSQYMMELKIEVKQDESWRPIITRRFDKTTKAGETVTTIIHHGDTRR
jgi:hypothetical protein